MLRHIDTVIPMYNLMEYSNSYSKTSGGLWQYYRDEPFLDDNGAIADLPARNNNSASFKFKLQIASRIGSYGTKSANIRVPLKYLSNFWRSLAMQLIKYEINLILTCSARCLIIAGQEPTFTITDTRLYVPVVTLSIQYNAKLLQQFKSGFKRTINWNKYSPKVTVQEQSQHLDFLINTSFQKADRLFVLSFENNGDRTSYTRYYLSLIEIRDYNVMIDGQNFFDQPVKSNLIIHDNT